MDRKKERIQKVKAEMGRLNHTQQDLAKLLKVSIASVHRKLNGHSEFKIAELDKLAEIYAKDSYYFY